MQIIFLTCSINFFQAQNNRIYSTILPRLFGTFPTILNNKNPRIATWDLSQPIFILDPTKRSGQRKDTKAQNRKLKYNTY